MARSKAEIESKVRELMARVFGASPGSIGADATPDTVKGWDSLKHMHLVVALEEEFGIQFDEDAIASMNSFAKLTEGVARLAGS